MVIPVGNSGGYNTLGTYVNGLVTDFINICSVTGGGGFANNFTMVLSHELAEDITDPTGNSGNGVTLAFSTSPNFPGFTNETTNPPGINNIAGLPGNVGYLNNSGVVQIGDGEAEPAGEAHYGYELNGVEVQGLWSAATLDKNGNPGAYIVADGNSQTVYLDPIWTNGTIPGTTPPITGPVFTGNYNLTLEGNAISVNASDGLTTATVDGQSFSFDNFGSAGGEIQNITIETVGNNATVNLLNLAGDQSATIEGNGSDTVTIGSGGSSSTTSGIQGPVNITNTTLNGTTIKINDSGDAASQEFSVNNVLGLGTVEQVGSAGILFSDADTSSLTLETGTAQNNSVFVGADSSDDECVLQPARTGRRAHRRCSERRAWELSAHPGGRECFFPRRPGAGQRPGLRGRFPRRHGTGRARHPEHVYQRDHHLGLDHRLGPGRHQLPVCLGC